jgi:hypothetical protein
MATPLRDDSLTTTSYITVTWTALSQPENGMSDIISYNLRWDGGSSGTVYNELVGETTNYLLTTFTVSSAITPGSHYMFKVRARNSLGWGEFSDVVTVKAATKPDQMNAPSQSIYAPTGGL